MDRAGSFSIHPIRVNPDSVLPNLTLDEEQRHLAAGFLGEIARLSGADIEDDEPLDPELKAGYTTFRLRQALDNRALRLRNLIQPRFYPGGSSGASVPCLYAPDFVPFFEQPTFSNYVDCFLAQGATLAYTGRPPASPAQAVLDDLEAFCQELAAQSRSANAGIPGTLASEVRQIHAIQQRAAGLHPLPTASASAILLSGKEYLPFVKDLIDGSASEIRVLMYYFRFTNRKDSPTRSLMESLVAAVQRGVGLQVILDRDRKTDVYHSFRINRSAYQHLKSLGIPVRYDRPEQVTHSKVLLVDRRWVVTGSHNWTANSLLNYDDLSVCLDSPQAAADYLADFDARFAALK